MFQLFSSVSQGMFLVDRTCRIVWVNEGYQRFLPDLGFRPWTSSWAARWKRSSPTPRCAVCWKPASPC